jgi:hypothetical protein
MPIAMKVIITVASIVFALAVVLIDSRGNNAGPAWFWRGGSADLIRNAICRADGSFRRHTKTGILVVFAVFLAALWMLG